MTDNKNIDSYDSRVNELIQENYTLVVIGLLCATAAATAIMNMGLDPLELGKLAGGRMALVAVCAVGYKLFLRSG
jgi:hypothetical protein